ncbi:MULTISPECIES: fumarylacetoacetate hydrolase family protein [Variovorax]|jgi:5-oxopent-3-ene-1,2,5-tricarboxylate decarboxylase / 2-hydroxyhepta-2,4-diene-1,7-dioate isomerase|uniref:fumarylacetoacetate hydrolase family protein n=1 Tax=Variovorax TaxID=34072 RepID=UPI00086B362C|nr:MULTISPECIES: fumarylacetoacetate hydrolase family protein [Variovorax]MBN8754288.1 fumarylacetoacetate hydrolase family protein [Variovorax sp.]ODU18580.1 MAG: fumarylacetoacetate hydrolase [Variovorax sp. SCN 67-85]ODV25437.1 MAG: fumarylacetoacetate hydrolase [Variovorax sp. SCN 67-20]OJZ05068.1 MAG: fumarylacetoacetate hydrolase [Variovorax sp. 67-131]UKI09009.1 fumarylacetoacetate hydrolase family protein [Variovorax paradoxus]
MSTPHFLPTGTVYGTLLNFRAEAEALAPQMTQPPYKAPPKAPVLYVKTANTWSPHGSAIAVPADVPEVEIGASIGMVIGAEGDVEGFVLLNDLSIPHASFFRPPVKFKCVDGFLGIGPALRDAQDVADPAGFRVEVRVNGELKQSLDFSQLVRPAQQLLADVGDFMTLAHGDVLMLGCGPGRPLARAGDRIDISAPGFETLSNTLVKEAA